MKIAVVLRRSPSHRPHGVGTTPTEPHEIFALFLDDDVARRQFAFGFFVGNAGRDMSPWSAQNNFFVLPHRRHGTQWRSSTSRSLSHDISSRVPLISTNGQLTEQCDNSGEASIASSSQSPAGQFMPRQLAIIVETTDRHFHLHSLIDNPSGKLVSLSPHALSI